MLAGDKLQVSQHSVTCQSNSGALLNMLTGFSWPQTRLVAGTVQLYQTQPPLYG